MKLFITNRDKFLEDFPKENNYLKTGAVIHKEAFSILSAKIADNNIPIVLMTNYDDNDGVVCFDFKKKIENVYFYEYVGVAE